MAKSNNQPKSEPKKPSAGFPGSKAPIQLPSVTVKATMPSPKSSLYPKGTVTKKQIDSIKVANPKLSAMIGAPIKKYSNSTPQYGTNSSDLIKQAIKPKKEKEAKIYLAKR